PHAPGQRRCPVPRQRASHAPRRGPDARGRRGRGRHAARPTGRPHLLDVLTLTADWGDGSPVETVHPGRDPFELTHRYLDNPPGNPAGSYTVRFSWTDGHGEVRSDSRAVTVRNVAPAVDVGGHAVLPPGGVLDRSGSFTDPGADTWTATV